MRWATALAPLLSLVGCELVLGLSDKSLTSTPQPSVSCAKQGTFLFCDDFDSITSVGELTGRDGWLWGPMSSHGSSFVLDSTDFATSPNSVQVVATPTQGAQSAAGAQIMLSSASFRLAFDLRVDQTAADLDGVPQVGIAQTLANVGTAQEFHFDYQLGPGATCAIQAFVGGQPTGMSTTLAHCPALKTWTHIEMSYDASAGLLVLQDGQMVGMLPDKPGAPGATQFILGAAYVNAVAGKNSSLTLELDDVVVRSQ